MSDTVTDLCMWCDRENVWPAGDRVVRCRWCRQVNRRDGDAS